MKAKKAITAFLLLFVGVSIIYLFISGGVKASPGAPESPRVTSEAEPKEDEKTAESPNRVEVIYFHGNRRCGACSYIESYSREAVQENFPDQLRDGTVVFKTVNVQSTGNNRYLQKYEISHQTVIISEIRDGEEVNWRKLDQVWQLVNSRPQFVDFVSAQVKETMEKNNQ